MVVFSTSLSSWLKLPQRHEDTKLVILDVIRILELRSVNYFCDLDKLAIFSKQSYNFGWHSGYKCHNKMIYTK